MTAIITLLCVLSISLFVTRVASVALAHTGLSRESARFQARSAFTGVGFTTNESERVVDHPVRRRILMLLMLFGNAGIVTAVSSLILTFLSLEEQRNGSLWKLGLLVAGLVVLVLVGSSRWVDRRVSRWISWALGRWTRLDVRDYDSLLQLSGEFRVSELHVEDRDWMAGRTLAELELRAEGLNVLAVRRADGAFEGNPTGRTRIESDDSLILYGRVGAVDGLDTRRRGRFGDAEHRVAVREVAEGAEGAEEGEEGEAPVERTG